MSLSSAYNRHLAALAIGFGLDALIGDPPNLPHPIRAIGKLIDLEERLLRESFPATPETERKIGALMTADVTNTSVVATVVLLHLLKRIDLRLALLGEGVICYYMLAARSLLDESMKVYTALETGTIEDGRKAVSMIVGRDTACLDEAGVVRATVETVAENTSDGVVAPMLYAAIGGAPAAVAYKAINTMDSMVGYKNERYLNFGRASALVDDVVNFIPARVSGLLMCAAASLAGFDGAGAVRVFARDRLAHTSPNSAHTEAACAGALGLQLGGGNYYFGTYVDKPTIGDATRPIERADIKRANRLMYATAALTLGVAAAFGFAVGFLGRGTKNG